MTDHQIPKIPDDPSADPTPSRTRAYGLSGFVDDDSSDGFERAKERRCKSKKHDGSKCRGRAIADSDFCVYHDPDHDPAEMGRAGAKVTNERRALRDRLRDDADTEAAYEKILGLLNRALEAEIVSWAECGHCHHKVRAVFPDIRSQLHAAQFYVDQAYGKPATTVRVESEENPLKNMPTEELRRIARRHLESVKDTDGEGRTAEAAIALVANDE